MTRGRVFAVMAVCAGLVVGLAACGGNTGSGSAGSSTLQVASLPSAEAWLDGKPVGSTPLTLPVAPGKHEIVLRQVGFEDQREVVEVAAGAVASVDGALVARDASDPDALKKLAAAFDVAVEPVATPELHRGAAGGSDVMLLFPRNDVRLEGLRTFRVDVSPDYEGGGTLEFRKGRTVLHSMPFEPQTLVTVGNLPASVVDSVKAGDTVTWGVFFSDRRKAITAQFEVVSKPQATKKLAAIDSDKRLAKQPAEIRDLLKAEALQNYRLYSEALVTFLEVKAASKDSTLPHGGIVACLRRMDLEDTPLFSDSAGKLVGTKSHSRPGADATQGRGAVAVTQPKAPVATSGGSSSSGLKPGGAVAPGSGTSGTTPPAAETPGSEPTVQPPVAGDSPELAARIMETAKVADEARRMADESKAAADAMKGTADEARKAADDARAAAEEARRDADMHRDDPDSPRYQEALLQAQQAAEQAQANADQIALDAKAAAVKAQQAEGAAKKAEEVAAGVKAAAEPKTGGPVVVNPGERVSPPTKDPRDNPIHREDPRAGLTELRAAADKARIASEEARAAADEASRVAAEHADQPDAGTYADEAGKAAEKARVAAEEAARADEAARQAERRHGK